ncbi:hypothetical protein [Enterococcus mundtii]|uniref:Uncharacterized protein n=1 Tax=Enterococcus mundtii TaxID=53346 RepID=A0A242L214_ENTMU|nr:hypothetical protein [Enterococcus mundtii]OTP28236.1 hypothetical protein A5802_001975 [Enterococcus mundtii]
MTSYLATRRFNSSQDSMDLAKKEDVMNLLDDGEISLSVKEITEFFSEDKCNVAGSKKIIKLFNQIKNQKKDMLIPIEDISLTGFDGQNLILAFKEQAGGDGQIAFNATGIYSFSGDFLDQLFCLEKFAGYCFRINERDLLHETIEHLLGNTTGREKQYRLIYGTGANENKVYLRAITSDSYKNYDNNVVMYLALNSMHRYSKRTGNKVYVESAVITDSSLDMSIKIDKRIAIGKKYFVEIGVKVLNSEIREGAVLFEFIYTIFDSKGNKSTAIGDSVVKIQHNNITRTVKERMAHLNLLDKHSDSVLKGITETRLATKLNEDELFAIFEKFYRSKTLTSGTKTKLSQLQKNEIVDNTLTLIELFGKLENLDTTIDDKVFIQKKFGEFIHRGF